MRPYCYLLILLSLFFSTLARAQFVPTACPDATLEVHPDAVCNVRTGVSFLVFGSIEAPTPTLACAQAGGQLGQASNTTVTCGFNANTNNCVCADSDGTPRSGPRVVISPLSTQPTCPDGYTEQGRVLVALTEGFRALMPSCLAPDAGPPVEPPPAPPEPEVRQPACPVAALSAMSDPIALQHEGGQYAATSDIAHLQAGTRIALACLQKNAPQAMLVSGFWPNEHQQHLKEVWDAWHSLQNNDSPECKTLRENVRGEWLKHKLIRDPVTNAAQAQGAAVDVAGVDPHAADQIAGQCGLFRPDPAGSPLHFQSGSN